MDPSAPTRADFQRMFAPGPSNSFEHLAPKYWPLVAPQADAAAPVAGNPFADLLPSKKRLLSDEEILASPAAKRLLSDEEILGDAHETIGGRLPGRPDYRAMFAPEANNGGLQSRTQAKASSGGGGPIDFMTGYTRSLIGQGVGLGFGDEAEAGVRAGLAKASGDERELSEIYGEQLSKIRSEQNQFAEAHPYISTGAELTGGLMAAAATRGKSLEHLFRASWRDPERKARDTAQPMALEPVRVPRSGWLKQRKAPSSAAELACLRRR
jgi:hypothetical protein